MKEIEISSVSEYIQKIEEIYKDKQAEQDENYIDVSFEIKKLKQEKENLIFNENISNEELFFLAKKKQAIEKEIEVLSVFERNNKTAKEKVYYNETMNWKSDVLTKYSFFYRGHYDFDYYKLVPSVMRQGKGKTNELNKEDYYYHQIKVQCADSFQNSTHIDQLVRMQHYDCPTRLLDVTSNPLVALYFACKNYSCEKCCTALAGAVYIFAIPENEVLYYDSDKARMLASLPPFSYTDKKDIYKMCLEKIKKGGKFDASNNGLAIERLYHEIRTETPSFEKKIDPVDLLSAYFVRPLKTNSRILKQDGAFIINGLSLNEKEAETKLNKMVYVKLKIQNQEGILRELDMLGVNEATLFPEVDKVANYLKSK